MATQEFLLPDVGEGLEAGTIVQWLVAEGDAVTVDQIIVEIETDKAVVEIPAPVTGTLTSHGGQAGATLPVGSVLATFETDNAATTATTTVTTTVTTTAAASATTADSAIAESTLANSQSANQLKAGNAAATGNSNSAATSVNKRILASPATRKFARNQQIDLALVPGTGSRGQITQKDVENYLAGQATVSAAPSNNTAPLLTGNPLPDVTSAATASGNSASGVQPNFKPAAAPSRLESRTEPLSGLRKQIATNMQAAWREIPHVFTFEDIDATALSEARRELNLEFEAHGHRVSFLPFFVKACVIALHEHPRFNASLNMADESVTYHGACNIGIATATPEGLIVTVVHNAEQKSILDISQEITTLASLARERRVTVEQIKGGTFTISNFGSYGGTLGTPIIRPPEVAIAGFGRIHEKVVAVAGEPVVRNTLPLAVSTDHRLNDGEHLGGFVSTLSRLLENPVRMLGHL